MKSNTCLVVMTGECVARATTSAKAKDITGQVDILIGAGFDNEFSEWQIKDLLEVMQANYKAKGKP